MSGDTVDTHVGFKSIEKINAAIHWFDEFLLSISTLLLGIALMLAIADVGTNGIIFRNPLLLIGWSVATGIGIESQLRTLVRRAKLAYKVDWLAFVMWVFLAIIIFVVSAVALVIFNTEKMLGLTENQALSMAHIEPYWYALGRAILSVTLVVISGFAYYKRAVARPDTETEIAQLRHKQAVLPLQMEVDALEAQRKLQNDTQTVRRGVNVVASAATEIRARAKGGQEQNGMTLVPASATRIVDADEPDPDDDPTPPRGTRAPSSRGLARGRRMAAQIMPPTQIAGMEVARSTSPLRNARVDAAMEFIAASTSSVTLQKLANHVNAIVTDGKLTAPNTMGIRNEAIGRLYAEGRCPKWAQQFIINPAA